MTELKKCYIYTRVSTSMQVDGFSLDAQRDKMEKYAKLNDLEIVRQYSDAGKSGKNIAGRLQFQMMMNDIEQQRDDVSFVLVYKLSRFGRNAADIMVSLQRMQDYGVNLICTDESIDSSKESGKLVISVLSAVAEIERENIREQSMAGKYQKAKEGKWNGGAPPYGYQLIDGKLVVVEEEAQIITTIFDKYVNTNMGCAGIAKELNRLGIIKQKKKSVKGENLKKVQLERYTRSFVSRVLDNPIYAGYIVFGRRKNEKIKGKTNEFHFVEQDEDKWELFRGEHQPIIDVEMWDKTRTKKKVNYKKREKIHHLEHEHKLSGIVRCPVCGAPLYGNKSDKKNKQGVLYKTYYSYACKHRLEKDGHKCDWHRQISEDKIDDAVTEIIIDLVKNQDFAEAIKKKINTRIDTISVEEEYEALKKQYRLLVAAKDRLYTDLNSLNPNDKHYKMKKKDIQNELEKKYDEIEENEKLKQETKIKLDNLRKDIINVDTIYKILADFETYFNKFNDLEKKRLFETLIERIEIYPEEQANKQWIKSITFKFPVFYDGRNLLEIRRDNCANTEVVCLLVNHKKPDTHVKFSLNMEDYHGIKRKNAKEDTCYETDE